MTVVTDGVGKDILGQRKSLMLYADEPLLSVFFPPTEMHSELASAHKFHATCFPSPSPPQPSTHPGQPTNLPARQLSRYVTRRGPKVPIRPISPLVQRVARAATSLSFSKQQTRHLPPTTPHWLLPGFFSLSPAGKSPPVFTLQK